MIGRSNLDRNLDQNAEDLKSASRGWRDVIADEFPSMGGGD
jgi:hypothetical protein